MENSALYFTFITASKGLTVSGIAAVRETNIDVYIRDGNELISSGLTLKIQVNGNNGATTPVGTVTDWTTSGDDAKGTLSLNTDECIAAFANVQNTELVYFNALVYTSSDPKLECNGLVGIINFPSSSTVEPTPATSIAALGQYASANTTIEKVNELISAWNGV